MYRCCRDHASHFLQRRYNSSLTYFDCSMSLYQSIFLYLTRQIILNCQNCLLSCFYQFTYMLLWWEVLPLHIPSIHRVRLQKPTEGPTLRLGVAEIREYVYDPGLGPPGPWTRETPTRKDSPVPETGKGTDQSVSGCVLEATKWERNPHARTHTRTHIDTHTLRIQS